MVGALVCFSCSPAPVDRPDAGNPVDGGSDSGVDAGAIDSGPPSCDGCWKADGGCLALNRTTVQECGPVGQACTPCYPSDLCSLGVCETNGEPTQIGASCFDKAYCERGFGPEAICKLTTTSGNDTYLNGLCTLPCGSAPCPVGSICVVFPPDAGEADVICLDRCSPTDRCRTGYACTAFDGGNACWIGNPVAPDAGVRDNVGNACPSPMSCSSPPDTCLTDAWGLSWPGGYCTRTNCVSDAECSPDGGALCLGFSPGTQACLRRCADSRDAGQSTCRASYHCYSYVEALGDGGSQRSLDGFCAP